MAQEIVRIGRCDGAQQAHRGDVFGLRQGTAQADRAFVDVVVVLRCPFRPAGFGTAQGQWRIVHLGARGIAFFQRR